jgi:hypothetical protein
MRRAVEESFSKARGLGPDHHRGAVDRALVVLLVKGDLLGGEVGLRRL